MAEITRYCPLCDTMLGEPICPKHGVPTIAGLGSSDLNEDSLIGRTVADRYRVERLVSKGGMGTVFRATQVGMNRAIALKVLHRDLMTDPATVKRFYREAQAIASVQHPNIVPVFDFGIDETTRLPYLAMEFLEGLTLRALLERGGPFSEIRACHLLAQISRALVEAHGRGLVHRDLKSANIMVARMPDGDEHAWVLDFGVAKWDAAVNENITQTGSTVGTPSYMSPEQAAGEPLDHRADLYSLGCILHELLTGQPPFVGKSSVKVMYQQLNAQPPPIPGELSDGQAPTQVLLDLHTSLLAKDPIDRPPDASAAAQVFAQLARSDSSSDVVPVWQPSTSNSGVHGSILPLAEALPPTPQELDVALAPTLLHDTVGKQTQTRRRWWPWLALLLALVGTSAVALGVSQWGRSPQKPVASAPVVETKPPVPEPAPPLKHRLSIFSRPLGAEVWQDGVQIGTTPMHIEVLEETSQTSHFELRLSGYKTYAVSKEALRADAELHIPLVAEQAPPPPARPTRRPPPPAENDDLWDR